MNSPHQTSFVNIPGVITATPRSVGKAPISLDPPAYYLILNDPTFDLAIMHAEVNLEDTINEAKKRKRVYQQSSKDNSSNIVIVPYNNENHHFLSAGSGDRTCQEP